jgi:hypothetical protein
VREGLLRDWFKRIAEAANKAFMEHKEVLGIIVSGSGPIKDEFLRDELLFADVKENPRDDRYVVHWQLRRRRNDRARRRAAERSSSDKGEKLACAISDRNAEAARACSLRA